MANSNDRLVAVTTPLTPGHIVAARGAYDIEAVDPTSIGVVTEATLPGLADELGVSDASLRVEAQEAADRAEAAAASIGAVITTTDPGFEGAVGDAEGRPSWLQYDDQGLPTPYVADALDTVGVPHAEDAGDGLTIAGEDGTPTWLSATGEGGPDATALTWLANAMHVHVGPDEPEVYPGGWIVWTRTDAAGTPIETLIGRN